MTTFTTTTNPFEQYANMLDLQGRMIAEACHLATTMLQPGQGDRFVSETAAYDSSPETSQPQDFSDLTGRADALNAAASRAMAAATGTLRTDSESQPVEVPRAPTGLEQKD